MGRVGIYGWGIVAPKSPNIDRFAENLESTESWLAPFNGFGPDNFLVGMPEFDFADYRQWITGRFSSNRFRQLDERMDASTKYAIGSFVQSLQQNPGIETELQKLGSRAHVYVGTGLGSLPTHAELTLVLYKAQRTWDRFWSDPERNSALREYLELSDEKHRARPDVPPVPETVELHARSEAEDAWWHYWASRSPELAKYLAEAREIEDTNVEGDVETAKLRVIREKHRLHAKLQEKWRAPDPPWTAVPASVIWNIPNTPACQISMMGRITGATFAPAAACSTFGVALKLGMDAIRRGEAKAVVLGATDPPPHPLTVGAFYNARVLAADGGVSKPLTRLRGTHVSGGSVIWIVGDYEYMTQRGFRPLGMEPVAVAVTADADHIITPSREGPTRAMRSALRTAGVRAGDIGTWDLHATATPGDFTEVETLSRVIPGSVLVTARKGTFGHGMSAGGGWELSAQYLGCARGRLYPTPLTQEELNREIGRLHERFVFDRARGDANGIAGKLSMGIGGINACVISCPWGGD
ncbi:MAG: beta-ketoacyl synthase N-terminal-like domain-containing protein [Candidatus Krumholzibacteriia bacterium]